MKSGLMKALVSVAAAGLLTVACASQSEVATTTEMGTAGQTELSDDRLPTWETLVSNVGESTVRGEVAVRALPNDETYTSIAIEGAAAGAIHPWHVHAGDCGSGGAIVGSPASYPPITVGADGEGEATATIDRGLSEDGDYYVNVHASPTDLATIVACGELHTN